ncbi:MAG: phosphatidate cytidylyltransferase [Bacteroidales bacterium]
MKELIKRTLSGIIYVLVIVLLLRTGSAGMFLLILFAGIVGLSEFYRLSYKSKYLPYRFFGSIMGILLIILGYAVAGGFLEENFIVLGILFLLLPVILSLFYQPSIFYGSWLSTLAGIVYVSLPLALVPFIAFIHGNYQYEIILSIFILLWIYDSFAYLVGSWIGKNRIYAEVSPKKSWEGAIGGMVFTIGGAILLSYFFEILTLWEWIIIAIITTVTGTIGDFIESGIKRTAGEKDSGRFMPGHGGVLDRFDSFLFSVPFLFMYLYICH